MHISATRANARNVRKVEAFLRIVENVQENPESFKKFHA
jgi:hypothetical protein